MMHSFLPRTAGEQTWYCSLLWEGITNGECPCLLNGNATDRQMMDEYAVQYNVLSEQLAQEFQAQNNPNFTVVVQPGLSGIPIAVYGEQYLSSLDCFHPKYVSTLP